MNEHLFDDYDTEEEQYDDGDLTNVLVVTGREPDNEDDYYNGGFED